MRGSVSSLDCPGAPDAPTSIQYRTAKSACLFGSIHCIDIYLKCTVDYTIDCIYCMYIDLK